jgi:aspartyl protease family protein
MLGWLVAGLLILAGLFAVLRYDPALLAAVASGDRVAMLIASGLMLLLVFSLLGSYRGRLGEALRHLTIWTAIGTGFVTAYAYRDELTTAAYRVAGELLPPGQTITVEETTAGQHAVRIRRRGDGHFVARTDINGVGAGMLVDTGASTVVLKPADAERIGLDVKRLSYTVAVQTANGTTYAAPVRLKMVAIGPIRLRDVEALVAKPGTLKESLLGMSFLRRLRSYEFSGDFLTLRS